MIKSHGSATIISWKGNINEMTYVVPSHKADKFMARFNDHGNWQVVKTGPILFIDMEVL